MRVIFTGRTSENGKDHIIVRGGELTSDSSKFSYTTNLPSGPTACGISQSVKSGAVLSLMSWDQESPVPDFGGSLRDCQNCARIYRKRH